MRLPLFKFFFRAVILVSLLFEMMTNLKLADQTLTHLLFKLGALMHIRFAGSGVLIDSLTLEG